MGPFLLLNAALVGFFAFAAVYHLLLWWPSRREILLAAFSFDCAVRTFFSVAAVATATATTPTEAQSALHARLAFGILIMLTWVWNLALISGVRARWFVWPVTMVLLILFPVHTFLFPLNATVLSVETYVAPWGETISNPQLGPSGWWFGPLYAVVISIELFGLYCGSRLWMRDRVGGTLILLANCAMLLVHGANVVKAFGILNIPFIGAIGHLFWACLIGLLIARRNHRMREQLAASEQRFRGIFDQTFQFIGLMSTDGTLIEANRTALESVGIRDEDVIGKPFWDTPWWSHSPDLQNRLRQAIRDAAGGRIVRFEATHPRSDGKLAHVDFSLKPVRDERGEVTLLIPEGRDITDRKRAEESLRESEERYRSLVDNAPIGLYVNRENRFVYVNDATCRLMGAISKDQLLGTSILDRFPPEILPAIHARIERALVHGEAAPLLEHHYLRLDGSKIDVEAVAIPIQFNHQPAIQVVITDITERKRAEERLSATEKRLATIFSSCPVGMCITSLEDGTLLEVNDVCCKIAKCRREDVLGRTIDELGFWLVPDERQKLVRDLLEHGSLRSDELAFRHQDGTIGYALRSLERLTLEGQDCILSMFIEITERKRIDEELRVSRQRLESLSRQLIATQEAERRHLARELHDQIGQLLTAIKMNLRQTQRVAEAHLQSHLGENVALVDQAINQVRNLSLSLRPPQLDELGLVAALHWLVKLQARSGGFVDHLDVDLGDVQIPADLETVCFRIAQEALTNTVRHGECHNVHVKLRASHSELSLSIHDDGIGFDVGDSRIRAVKGDSIGLISMQERASLVGGQIEIDSTPGHGTRLHIRLPL